MADCSNCGKNMGLADRMNAKSFGGKCRDCSNEERIMQQMVAAGIDPAEIEQKALEQYAFDAEIDAIILTTETAPNLQISERIEIITAEVAYGMHIFKDLFAEVRDVIGGRSKAVQNTMRDARRTALYELKREAFEVGANAVVGVDLDYVELSSGKSMVMLVASGTAVVVEDL